MTKSKINKVISVTKAYSEPRQASMVKCFFFAKRSILDVCVGSANDSALTDAVA